MNHLRAAAAFATAISLILWIGASPIQASDGDANDVASAINKVSPPAVEARTLAVRGADRAFSAGAAVSMPADASGEVVLRSSSSGRAVGLSLAGAVSGPASLADDGTVVYGSTGGIGIGVQAFGASVRVAAVLQSPRAGSSIPYSLDLPKGAHLTTRDDGGIFILGADGSLLGGVATPWARDAKGQSVATSYAVRGTTLVQTIEPSSTSVYPIVADPYFFIDLIDHATWVYHSGYGWTLQVSPTTWGRLNGGAYGIGAFAWDELYTKYRNRGLCCNLNGMRDQLICHWQFAFWRNTYNLDEWRPDVGYVQTVNSSCNPGGPVWFD